MSLVKPKLSTRKMTASQPNARKSTGPKTAEGKARVTLRRGPVTREHERPAASEGEQSVAPAAAKEPQNGQAKPIHIVESTT